MGTAPRCHPNLRTANVFHAETQGNSGDVYEQAVVKTVAGFLRGNSTHLFGVTRFGAPVVYVRAGSSHLNEVAMPQSPGTESTLLISGSVVRLRHRLRGGFSG